MRMRRKGRDAGVPMIALLILVLVVPHPPRHIKSQAACKGEEEGVEVYSVSALGNGHAWEMVLLKGQRVSGVGTRWKQAGHVVRRRCC